MPHEKHAPATGYAPPPGAPPSKIHPGSSASTEDPPPYHDWTIIPDTALLPPPPTIHHNESPTANASLDEAERAHEWCHINRLIPPQKLSVPAQQARRNSQYLLNQAQEFSGNVFPGRTPGTYRVEAKRKCTDCILITALPMYSANLDSPLMTEVPKTIYFEIKVDSMGTGRAADEAGIAIGFVALPYPTWRLPGWERGSLGVHGDDGRRYMNDTWGGKDFTRAFKRGDTVGVGMKFSVADQQAVYGSTPIQLKAEVFFTRNGKRENGWDVHEEKDSEDQSGPVEGLEGFHDLYPAVGMFGESAFHVVLNPREWNYQPV
ncbi:MAG: hypothetical protein M1820_005783 [Bogoriella megaspora]|nr:MAG: hypothetical protein M1820_005783 [Bogoriella megaspora]